MPMYCYKCPTCGCTKEVSKPMSESASPELCKNDSFVMNRDLPAEQCEFNHRSGNWPMESIAAGVAANQAVAAAKHAADNGVPTHFSEDGNPIFTGASHRKRYCRLVGLHDRNGGYSDP